MAFEPAEGFRLSPRGGAGTGPRRSGGGGAPPQIHTPPREERPERRCAVRGEGLRHHNPLPHPGTATRALPTPRGIGHAGAGGRTMTEQEWLACVKPTHMMEHLGWFADTPRNSRKENLHAVGCWRRIAHLITGVGLRGVELYEKLADGLVTED